MCTVLLYTSLVEKYSEKGMKKENLYLERRTINGAGRNDVVQEKCSVMKREQGKKWLDGVYKEGRNTNK